MHFDPNAAASEDSGIFGLLYEYKDSALVYLPVPWEPTTSFGKGTAKGPEAILEASHQVDLFDLEVQRPYEAGLFTLPEEKDIRTWNRLACKEAEKIIAKGGAIGKDKKLAASLAKVNNWGDQLNDRVREQTQQLLKAKKIPALIGGDHSTPFGALQAIAQTEKSFGILHIDAHSDTRKAYEGFTWSHASIMYNVLEKIPEVSKLVQVGIRDFCEEEYDYIQGSHGRIRTYFDYDLQRKKQTGSPWLGQAQEIIQHLPEHVWISFDIDGLDPVLCPTTGTPVPGGLSYSEALTLLGELARSRKKIVGFDLNEVGAGAWDANVGARLLYKMTAYTLANRGLAKWLDRR